MTPDDVPEGPLLVDTDVVSFWTAGSPLGSKFSTLVAGRELAISFATYGELLANGYRNRWGQSRIKRLQTHLHRLVVIPYNESIVVTWAQMHAKLSGHLHKGGTNDLWTAACAISIKPCMPIVTNNLTDFRAISTEFPRLQIVHPDL